MSDNRKPTANQLATNLPGPTAYLTGHDQRSGKAIVHSKRPVNWASYDDDKLSMSVAYTTQFPADLNDHADVALHQQKLDSGKLGLVSGGGTVLRYVDFAPGYECMMHRTQSVDYGIVIEGEIESKLDSGETQLMKRGDVMVQRATMHSWRNPSADGWARMIFVLQDCQPLFVAGERFGEDLGRGTPGLPQSGNDQ
ncbi:Putative rmlC-like cupin domain superfamily, rmlC-like jelly roll protein [Septoria linicola]|uniref:RmlC-like cupin domain superfamily, rmlC-like jelly roll protein n=1 Tax=Septoria linicola TaxID=215465 RepID=A0A9Q9AIB5_9PEZI|nr:putative rmlC-like cupin domain superfamily, rmlC-like jelly roll protein [Septoria linicola]USW47453.1 Putative rmlC-like cupin domain superfamily, rmlC-like jelly roll protein [Septoria linicola]